MTTLLLFAVLAFEYSLVAVGGMAVGRIDSEVWTSAT